MVTLVARGVVVAIWTGLFSLSFPTFARLVSVTLFLLVVTLAAWAGPVVDWLRR